MNYDIGIKKEKPKEKLNFRLFYVGLVMDEALSHVQSDGTIDSGLGALAGARNVQQILKCIYTII